MSLASAMSTALTGLNASERRSTSSATNLANANTVGFKGLRRGLRQSVPANAECRLRTTDASGGSAIRSKRAWARGGRADHAQFLPGHDSPRPIVPPTWPIQGDGFFIVQGRERPAELHPQRHLHHHNAQDQWSRPPATASWASASQQFRDRRLATSAAYNPLGNAMVARPPRRPPCKAR